MASAMTPLATEKSRYLERYQNWNKNQRTEQLCLKLAQTPLSFLQWSEQRKTTASDLMPLNGFEDLSDINPLLNYFEEQKLTRSSGKQVLDLLTDLVMMKTPSSQLKPCQGPWVEQLRKLRYPKASQQDQETGLQHQEWPQFARVQKKRHGDRLSYQMTLQFQDEDDLRKKLQRLSQKMGETND